MDQSRTAGQTVGPFFAPALHFAGDNRIVAADHPGAVGFFGVVYDGEGRGIPDALVELWQPDSRGAIPRLPGSLRRTGFTGWGRCATDAGGRFEFSTVTPGSVTGGHPFFALTVFARGLLDRLFTRAYLFPDGPLSDPVLGALDADRRNSLVCRKDPRGYGFDIRLQGPGETVFLDFSGAAR